MEKVHFSIALLRPRYWPVWLGIALWWLVVQILPFRVQMWLGAKLGRISARLSPRRRIITRKNIDLCFPEKSARERDQLFWQTMESTGRGFFDTGIAWFWPYWRLRKVLDVRGMDQVLAAREQGRGVLFFTYHFTSLEIGCAGVNRHYPHMNYGVYRPHANRVYDYVMRKGRERHAKNLEAVPRRDVRTMVRTLRKGQMLIYLPDQDYGPKYSVFVPFFGVDAATVTAPTQLVKMGRAKVLSFCASRKPDGSGYLVQVYPEFEGYGSGDERADACLMNEFLERRIREHPEQYLWVHRRFKSRPDKDRDFYGLSSLKSFQRRQRRRAQARRRKKVQREQGGRR